MPSEELLAELDSAADEAVQEIKEINGGGDDSGSEEKSGVSEAGDDRGVDDDPGSEPDGVSGGEGDQVGDDDEGSGEAGDGDSGGDAEPEGAEIDDDIFAEAIRAGMSVKDVQTFTSRDALERVIDIIKESKGGSSEEEKKDILDGIPDLDPEEHGEAAAKMYAALKDVAREQQERIAALESGHTQMNQRQYEEAARELISDFDGMVEKLGDSFHEELGVGPSEQLVAGSQGHVNRSRIMDHMAVLAQGYRASGQQLPSRKAMFDMAVNQVLSSSIVSMKINEAKSKLDEQQDSLISRPDGKRSKKKLDPFEETAAEIDRIFGK